MRSQCNSPVGRGPIKAFPLKLDQEEEERESDDTLVDAESDKTVIEREVTSEGPLLLKKVATNSKTTKLTTRLTYGISDSLDLGKEGSDVPIQSPVVKIEPVPEFTHRDLYLPIPGCPSVNQLEPIELNSLTPRGNHAKMVKILMLQPKYRAEYYVVDDITGEMYARTTEGLVAIKEQVYLDQAIALEATAAEFPEVPSASASPLGISKLSTDQSRKEETPDQNEKKEETQKKQQELTSKGALNQAVSAGTPVNSNYLQEKEQALLLHKRATQEYLAMRSQRKKLEGEMMIYKIPGKEPGVTMDQEIARERFYAEGACRRALDKEMPFFQKYLETLPMSPEVDTLSLSSLDSCEAEEWNEAKCRKLLFKYDHGERQYAVLNRCRDLDVLREPECATELNKELALSREELEQRQKKGAQLKEIAKAQVNFMRQRQNIVQEAIRIEQQKHQQEREEWYRSKEIELAERTRNRTEVAKKEIGKIREAYEQEKKE